MQVQFGNGQSFRYFVLDFEAVGKSAVARYGELERGGARWRRGGAGGGELERGHVARLRDSAARQSFSSQLDTPPQNEREARPSQLLPTEPASKCVKCAAYSAADHLRH